MENEANLTANNKNHRTWSDCKHLFEILIGQL